MSGNTIIFALLVYIGASNLISNTSDFHKDDHVYEKMCFSTMKLVILVKVHQNLFVITLLHKLSNYETAAVMV